MADFTLNAPGTTNNPFLPTGVITFASNPLKSDATGFRDANFVYTPFANNVSYGATITSTATIAAQSGGDDIYLGAVVRSGGNAGCMIAVWITSSSAIAGTSNAAGIFTSVSTATAITRAVNDLFSVTVSISGGTATVTCTQNGTPLTFSSNTTTTFAGEASLAAGAAYQPQNANGTYLSQFTGTGVSGGAAQLASASATTTASTGSIANPAYAPIPLDQANVDGLFAGSQPNDGTGTPGRSIVIFLKNWAAKLNQMLIQLYGVQSYQQPTTGFSIAVTTGVTEILLDPAGTLASGTITFPPSAIDRQPFVVSTSQTITALTVSPASGQSILGAPTTLTANTSFAYRYRAANATWYRLR